jgi:hypothetical protein
MSCRVFERIENFRLQPDYIVTAEGCTRALACTHVGLKLPAMIVQERLNTILERGEWGDHAR